MNGVSKSSAEASFKGIKQENTFYATENSTQIYKKHCYGSRILLRLEGVFDIFWNFFI